MKLGDQTERTNDTHLKYLARYGVESVCGYPEIAGDRLYATVDELKRMKELAAKYKISVDCVAPPFLASSLIDTEKHPAIMLAESPERDRDIEQLQTLIKNCAEAGIPAIKYNMSILGVLRTGRTPGRGDAMDSMFGGSLSSSRHATHQGRHCECRCLLGAHHLFSRPRDSGGERIQSAHGLPSAGPRRSAGRIPRREPRAGHHRRAQEIHHYSGESLSWAEFLPGNGLGGPRNPSTEIFDVIRYFGTRKKIFNVHFRNIRGHRNDFEEVFPDEGDVDFVKAIRVYKEIGYPYMLMPDHVPIAENDPGSLQSFAFCYGYIRGLIQWVNSEA